MDTHIAIKLWRVMIIVLEGLPPSLPPSGIPLASALATKERKSEHAYRWVIDDRWRRGLLVRLRDDQDVDWFDRPARWPARRRVR